MASDSYIKAIREAAIETGEFEGRIGGWIYRPGQRHAICQGWKALAEKVERISGNGISTRYDDLHQRAIDVSGSPSEEDATDEPQTVEAIIASEHEPMTKSEFDNQTWGKIRWNAAKKRTPIFEDPTDGVTKLDFGDSMPTVISIDIDGVLAMHTDGSTSSPYVIAALDKDLETGEVVGFYWKQSFDKIADALAEFTGLTHKTDDENALGHRIAADWRPARDPLSTGARDLCPHPDAGHEFLRLISNALDCEPEETDSRLGDLWSQEVNELVGKAIITANRICSLYVDVEHAQRKSS